VQRQCSGREFRTIDNVSLAYFADYREINGAVIDLCTAGFEAAGVNMSRSLAQHEAHPEEDGSLNNVIGSYNGWLWQRILAHDRRRRGVDGMGGLSPVPAEGANPTCSSFDMQIALHAMHMPAVQR
jgi:hypothetical protein